MTTYHGKTGVVKSGANVVSQTTKFTLNTKASTQDTTVQGSAWEAHMIGVNSWSGQIDCLFDATDTTGQETLIEGASITVNLYPYGVVTGSKYFTGTATIESLGLDSMKEGIVTRNFQFKGNGILTRSTAP